MFRRRRAADDDAVESRVEEADDTDAPVTDPVTDPDVDAEPTSRAVGASTGTGPWDSLDAPDTDAQLLDLGSLRVPVPDGLEVRVEVQDEMVVAATFVDGANALQVHAFAAPKRSGLWAEVRQEIAGSLRGSTGAAEDAEGPFGTELRARVPDETGRPVPARFLGVDGPRWFLRGLVTGPAATDPNQARRLEAAFRDVVVHRGAEAMAPRDLLPLHLPREAATAVQDAPPTLTLPERGPEITEIQ